MIAMQLQGYSGWLLGHSWWFLRHWMLMCSGWLLCSCRGILGGFLGIGCYAWYAVAGVFWVVTWVLLVVS